jgi:group II intron reverse transcriptase/maturase
LFKRVTCRCSDKTRRNANLSRNEAFDIEESTQVKEKLVKKINNLRKREYYPLLQAKFDELYMKSKDNINFNNLIPLITSTENILLAIQTIKSNRGRNTKGTNNTVMQDILDKPLQEIVDYIRGRLRDYQPQTIKRVYISKEKKPRNRQSAGKPRKVTKPKMRPLGIPTMEERLIQQCILQVLEPIAEAKFVHQSFGFRPHRGVHDALARVHNILTSTMCEYAVDMDIKSFFDTVSHSKLIKQLYTMGIHDKALLTIIKRMLKAGIVEPKFPKTPEIESDITTPDEGTPQGGILSPLLANIVLNELDHWVISQWEGFKTKTDYANQGNKIKALKKSKLKVMYYVRYADDFRIFANTYDSAKRIFKAVEMWLKERLHLNISEEKSQIVRLKQKHMKFLGITFKLVKNPKIKQHKYNRLSAHFIPHTSITDEKYELLKSDIRERVIEIKHTFKHEDRVRAILNYNAYIRGLSFYAVTSKWYKISSKLSWDTRTVTYNRLKNICKTRKHGRVKDEEESRGFKRKGASIEINGVKLLKPTDVSYEEFRQINPKVCKYTKEGRKLVHSNKLVDTSLLHNHFTENPKYHETAEYNVNRLAALSIQKGLCKITGLPLKIGFIHTHHIKPIEQGGNNKTSNLALLWTLAHEMIHAVQENAIKSRYHDLKTAGEISIKTLRQAAKINGTKPPEKWSDKCVLRKINKYRLKAGYEKLTVKEIL